MSVKKLAATGVKVKTMEYINSVDHWIKLSCILADP